MVYTCIRYDGNYDNFLDSLQYMERNEKHITELGIYILSNINISKVINELLKLDGKICLSMILDETELKQIPNEIFKLNIKKLQLNNFTNVPYNIYKFVNLEKLFIYNGNINFPNICNLKNLTNLDFYQTNIKNKIPFEITKLQKIKKIYCKSLLIYDLQNLKKIDYDKSKIKNKHVIFRLFFILCKNNKIINYKIINYKNVLKLLKYEFNESEYYDSDDELDEYYEEFEELHIWNN